MDLFLRSKISCPITETAEVSTVYSEPIAHFTRSAATESTLKLRFCNRTFLIFSSKASPPISTVAAVTMPSALTTPTSVTPAPNTATIVSPPSKRGKKQSTDSIKVTSLYPAEATAFSRFSRSTILSPAGTGTYISTALNRFCGINLSNNFFKTKPRTSGCLTIPP